MSVYKGRYVESDADDITDAMFALAQELHDRELSDDERSTFREFYRPVAEVISALQIDMSDLLDSTRLRYAEGRSLDLITQGFGVTRRPAVHATGTQQFYVDSALAEDVLIPEGTKVQTEGPEVIRFETTEQVTLVAGETTVSVPSRALEPGPRGNVGANKVVQWTNTKPVAALRTNNSNSYAGGRRKESDSELRKRAEKGGNENARGTHRALVDALSRLDGTLSVVVLVNDTNTAGGAGWGLPENNIEVVIDYEGEDQDVIDTIAEYKSAGEPAVGGINGLSQTGTYTLPNGQKQTIEWSAPTEQYLYMDLNIDTDPDKYEGDDVVADAVVDYVGGIYTDGSYQKRGLGVSEDVIYDKVVASIMNVDGVYDITNLEIDTTSAPTNTGNVLIGATDIAQADGRSSSGFFSITTSDI